jgi:predicted dehydrogenase
MPAPGKGSRGGAGRAGAATRPGRNRVRIAMVGAGGMATSVHYPSLRSFDDVDIVGVCEQSQDRLEAAGERFAIAAACRFHCPGPNDYQAVLQELRPDGVYVIGPPNLMFPLWVWCLQAGHNLYIEKPMGLSLHQAQMLAHLAAERSLITQVSHQRWTVPLYRRMREELLKKGPITHGVVEFYKCAMGPMLDARDHMMDDGTHAVDTARWICGGEVVEVDCHCKRIGVPDINWIGAMLHFDNGSTCFVICSWASGRRVFRVEMHAPGGYTDAEIEKDAYLYLDGDYRGQHFTTQEVAGSGENYVLGGFQAKNREFIDALKTGKDRCSSPFRDTVKTMEVCEVILAQAVLNGD